MASITVLGPVTVADGGSALPPRDRVVLSVLVARRGREVPAETIAEALWGERPPASSHKIVQGCVARLRRRLGHDAIVTGRSGYRLVVSPEDVDTGRFERLVRRAGELLSLGHADQAAYAADEALALWRGMPFADLADWAPGRGEAARLEELRLRAEELRLEALLTSGRPAEVLPEAALRVQEEPLREHRWALLTRAQYQDGRQAEALGTLRRARNTFAEELGLDPGPELVQLERAVLDHDPHLTVPPAGFATATCPWPGLASYDVEDADTFFGREAELVECLERLGRDPLLAVVGPSGSGKSSLVRAGVAARLRREGRGVRVLCPGARPLDELAAALDGSEREPVKQPVLVVDQCEEVFAPTVPETVRAAFLSRLAEQAGRGRVVVTLRADRLGELATYPAAARLVEEGLYLLTFIGPEGLREAIEQPARRAGLLLEQGLVDLLVRDVEGEPGSLPLLAHALRETWERREGSTLTVEGYRASGGIRGAVAQTAERVYEAATPEQRETLRELLLRMVQPSPGGAPVRTVVDRDTLLADPEHAALLEQLVRARLVTAEADRVEIAHEALVRAWPRLQAWLAEDVEGELIRHHLAAAATAWQAMGRPDSELYRGARLAGAREWRAQGSHRISRTEQEFLTASEEAHLSRLARAEDDARHHRRLNRRLRLLVVGATCLALVAATFGILALEQRQRARDGEASARAQELAAASLAAVDQDPALARALAVLGGQQQDGPPSLQSRDALHRAHAVDRVVNRLSMNRPGERLWAVLHPDGARVAMTAENIVQPARAVEVHDARTGALVWEWLPPEEPAYGSVVVAGAQYSPDGAVLATGVLWDPHGTVRLGPAPDQVPPPPDGTVGVHLRDARTHELLRVVDVGPCGGWPVAVAGDSLLVRTLAARPSEGLSPEDEEALLRGCRWQDGALETRLVNLATDESWRITLTEAPNLHLTLGYTLTDDGSLAAVTDYPTLSTLLVDGRTGEEVGRLENAFPRDFDSTGARLLTVATDAGATELWRVVSVPRLMTEAVYTGRNFHGYYGRFSPDDATVLTTGADNVLVQWDARTGRHLRSHPSVGGGLPTGSGDVVLVPRPETAGAVLLDTGPAGEPWSVPSCGGPAGIHRLRVAGELVVVGRECTQTPRGRLETWTSTGGPVRSWTGVSWESIEVSPDGRHVVTRDGPAGGQDGDEPFLGPLRVRDVVTGEEVVTLEGFCEHPLSGNLDDNRAVASAGRACERFPAVPFAFFTGPVRWSPDGRWIVALSEGAAVWDARTGQLHATPGHPGSAEAERWSTVHDARFTPDSRRLLLTTENRQVVAVDTQTWRPVHERTLDVQTAYSAALVGFGAEGELVVVTPSYQIAGNAVVLLLDPDTLTVQELWSGVADGAVQSAALSPDRTRFAVATSEGIVTVWHLATRARVDQADPEIGPLDGVQWLDDRRLVVLSADGRLSTLTTDPAELLELARGAMTRGLSRAECASFRIDPCPSLAGLGGSEAVVPEELRGTWTLAWDPAEIEHELLTWASTAFGGLDQESADRLREQADLVAGTYRVELREADYTITRDSTGAVWCSGSVTRSSSRPDHLLLGADDGERCTDFHYAEVGWELDGDRLRLPADEYRGADVDRLLWTGKPLQRVGG